MGCFKAIRGIDVPGVTTSQKHRKLIPKTMASPLWQCPPESTDLHSVTKPPEKRFSFIYLFIFTRLTTSLRSSSQQRGDNRIMTVGLSSNSRRFHIVGVLSLQIAICSIDWNSSDDDDNSDDNDEQWSSQRWLWLTCQLSLW